MNRVTILTQRADSKIHWAQSKDRDKGKSIQADLCVVMVTALHLCFHVFIMSNLHHRKLRLEDFELPPDELQKRLIENYRNEKEKSTLSINVQVVLGSSFSLCFQKCRDQVYRIKWPLRFPPSWAYSVYV